MEKTFVCLEDYEEEAKSTLKDSVWDFITSGACLSRTAKDNVEAYKKFVNVDYERLHYSFHRYYILPRVLCDISQLDTSTTLLGEKITFPLGATPTALNCLCHPDGELGVSKGR